MIVSWVLFFGLFIESRNQIKILDEISPVSFKSQIECENAAEDIRILSDYKKIYGDNLLLICAPLIKNKNK